MEITPKLSVTEDKIRLLTVKTDMFKTACLTLNVLVPMGEYAAEYAVLSSYLVHSSKKYDSLIKLNSRLEELYGALLSGSISRHGENYRIQLSITCIDDSLTFDGKSVTGASLELLLSLLTKPSADENGFSPEQLSTEIRLTACTVILLYVFSSKSCQKVATIACFVRFIFALLFFILYRKNLLHTIVYQAFQKPNLIE